MTKHTRYCRVRYVGDEQLARSKHSNALTALGKVIASAGPAGLGQSQRTVNLGDGVTAIVQVVAGFPTMTIVAQPRPLNESSCVPKAPEGFVCVPLYDHTSGGIVPPDWPAEQPDDPTKRPEGLLAIKGSGSSATYKAYVYSPDYNYEPVDTSLPPLHYYKAAVATGCRDSLKLSYPLLEGGNKDWVGPQTSHLSCSWFGTQSSRYFMDGGGGAFGAYYVNLDGSNYIHVSGFAAAAIFFRGIPIVTNASFGASSGGTPPAERGCGWLVSGCGMRKITGHISLPDGLYLFALVQDWFGSGRRYVYRWRVVNADPANYPAEMKYKAIEKTTLGYYDAEYFSYAAHTAFNASCTEARTVLRVGSDDIENQPCGLLVDLSDPTVASFSIIDEGFVASGSDNAHTVYAANDQGECADATRSEVTGPTTMDCSTRCFCPYEYQSIGSHAFGACRVIDRGNIEVTLNVDRKWIAGYDYKGDGLIKVYMRLVTDYESSQVDTGLPVETATDVDLCSDWDDCVAENIGPPGQCDPYEGAHQIYDNALSDDWVRTISLSDVESHYLRFEFAAGDPYDLLVYRRTHTTESVSEKISARDDYAEQWVYRPGYGLCPQGWCKASEDDPCSFGSFEFDGYDCTKQSTNYTDMDATGFSTYTRDETFTSTDVTEIYQIYPMHIDPRNDIYAMIHETVNSTITRDNSTSVSGSPWGVGTASGSSDNNSSTTTTAERYTQMRSATEILLEGEHDICTDSSSTHATPLFTESYTDFSCAVSDMTGDCTAGDATADYTADDEYGAFSKIFASPMWDSYRASPTHFFYSNGQDANPCIAEQGNHFTWMYRVHPQTNIVYYAGAASHAFKNAHMANFPSGFATQEYLYFLTPFTDSESEHEDIDRMLHFVPVDAGDTFYPIWTLYDKYPGTV